jgi:hypothetical protein
MGIMALLRGPGRFSLLVSLPANAADLAEAAIEGGADGLKLHLNVEHRASGTRFGTFEEEEERLAAVCRVAAGKAGLGIMPGSQRVASPAELLMLNRMGFEYMDCYVHDLPASYLSLAGVALARMLAVPASYRTAEVRELAALGADAVEASIVEPEGYGRPLTALDLARYRSLVTASGLPVVVPSQRHVHPGDVGLLARAGVRGLLIGAVVTGKTPASVRSATAAFRDAIENLA